MPRPGAESMAIVPPASAARSRSRSVPMWPSSPPAAAGSNPRPSSPTVSRTPSLRAPERDRDVIGAGVLERVPHGLLGDPEAERLALDVEVGRRVDVERRLDPPRLERREHVLEGGREAGPLQARRVDLDEQAAQRADAGAGPGGAGAELLRANRDRRLRPGGRRPRARARPRSGPGRRRRGGRRRSGGARGRRRRRPARAGGRDRDGRPRTRFASDEASGSWISSSSSSERISAGRNASQRSRPLEVTSL